MPRYRKRPVEVDAIRFDGENFEEIQEFTGERVAPYNPAYTVPLFDRVQNWWPEHETPEDIVAVVFDVLHSTWVGVKKDDYIIRGLKGEYYPHDGDLFATAYEEVEHYNDHDPLI